MYKPKDVEIKERYTVTIGKTFLKIFQLNCIILCSHAALKVSSQTYSRLFINLILASREWVATEWRREDILNIFKCQLNFSL